MARLVKANEATAARRRVYFHLVDATDGLTAETGEAGGQPQVSSDGGAWTNTGIGTLTAISNGRYYADLTQTLVANPGTQIETRYKSANTAESPGDSVQVVGFDPYDPVRLGLTALPGVAAGTVPGGLGLLSSDGYLQANLRTWRGGTPADLSGGLVPAIGDWLTAAAYSAPDNASIAVMRNILEADEEVNNAANPWELLLKQRGTSTVLLTKKLRQVGGAAVTATTQVIGSKKDA